MNITILTGQKILCGDECCVEIGDGDEKVTVEVSGGAVQISTARRMMIVASTSNIIRVRSVR